MRRERWGPRSIDLDLLLYGDEQRCDGDGELDVPHPRMHYRRFVLEPAAEVAPWMIHPSSGWSMGRLLAQLDGGNDFVSVAAKDAGAADEVAKRLNARIAASGLPVPPVQRWAGGEWNPGPKALLAVGPPAGTSADAWHKMLHLPATGPIAWLGADSLDAMADEAWSVLSAAWPEQSPAEPRA